MKTVFKLFFPFLLLLPPAGYGETIAVGSIESVAGNSVTMPVTVDVPGDIAAAVFTISYDGTVLTLTDVESTFFDTFSNQWASLSPSPSPPPPSSVTVNSSVYNQPMVHNNQTGHTLLLGYVFKPEQASLFSLT